MSFNFILIVDATTDVPIPPLLPISTQPQPLLPSGHHLTVVYVYVSCVYVLWVIPSPSFIRCPLSALLRPLSSVFHVSMPRFLFCLSVYSVHYIPHISEIIWYLSFSGLVSIISRAIHDAAERFHSFLWPCGIPLCKCIIGFFYPLIY